MSSSSVKFLNIQDFTIDLKKCRKIFIEYEVDKDVQISHNDWIAIYPHGANVWDPNTLHLIIAYEFVLCGPLRKEERLFKMTFSLKGAKNLEYAQKYQLVYVSKYSDIYGISKSFEFHPPNLNEIPENSYFSQESDEASKENMEESKMKFIDKKRKICRQKRQPLVKVESGRSESEDKNWSDEDGNIREAKQFINKFNKSKQAFMKKSTDISHINNSHMIPRLSPPISCSNCHRVAGLLRAQDELYNKIKNLAEMNSDLRNQVAKLQNRVELSQAAYQKLSVTLMREREAKFFYQAAAYERAEYEYQIMVVEPFVPSILIPTSRSPPVPERYRTEQKARVGCSVLKLKAIIGNQEEKIQALTKEVSEMKLDRAQRVTAIVKDIEELNTGN